MYHSKIISSKDNPTIKKYLKLKQKKYRDKYFLVEGINIIRHIFELCYNKKDFSDIKSIIFRNENLYNEFINTYKIKDIKSIENFNDVEMIISSDKIIKLLSDTITPQGIIAVIKKPDNKVCDINENDFPIILLDEVSNSDNIGAIIRSADAFGFKTVMAMKKSADIYSQKSIRASMGSISSLKIIDNVDYQSVEELKNRYNILIYGADIRGEDFNNVSIKDKEKLILVIGNEANGISDNMKNIIDYFIKIEMKGAIESLNASIAASILMYEIKK